MIGYLMMTRECKPVPRVVSPFIEAPFVALQTGSVTFTQIPPTASGISNRNLCQCGTNAACLAFRKGVEVLYPFSMEFYLMAACMIYITWKNVGRQMSPGHHQVTQKLTLDLIRKRRVIYGLVSGALVLLVGLVIFILYQMWVSQQQFRDHAFFMLYVYDLAVIPVMSLCCLLGLLVHRVERHAKEGGYNPTRNLDVALLIATASGQLALCYFSLVAALSLGAQGSLASLDLSYSILTMLEILLQSTFIIEGLHRHPNLLAEKKKKRRRRKFKSNRETSEDRTGGSGLEGDTAVRVHDGKNPWAQRIIKEICAFLILTNVMVNSHVHVYVCFFPFKTGIFFHDGVYVPSPSRCGSFQPSAPTLSLRTASGNCILAFLPGLCW
ncbi:unnamed protein product [Tetraodon nigroviridis]|uniref:(spotted green pufferfish) hypothetical protein n=1 Tax=Tetraodon nigroviridis TaxID=99883 RepID=Q4S8J2_TETNG|nr:unnamed protein product [Tetraodon nigroviridis]